MFFSVMAFGGCEGNKMEEKMSRNNYSVIDKKSNDNYSQDTQDSVKSEKKVDDLIQNSDSLSSSASASDSDLTSTDSDDSLALSESESITDVTPLNSPYCDSPLCQSRLSEHKLEERGMNSSVNRDSGIKQGRCDPPEVNILIQAIEKLEIEAGKGDQPNHKRSSSRRRTLSCGGEDAKILEQENQHLFKQVLAQRNRLRTLYSNPNQPSGKKLGAKHTDLVKSDGDISVVQNLQSPKSLKDSSRYSQRQQKCLSHPSYGFSHGLESHRKILSEDSSGKEDKNIPQNSVASIAIRALIEDKTTSE